MNQFEPKKHIDLDQKHITYIAFPILNFNRLVGLLLVHDLTLGFLPFGTGVSLNTGCCVFWFSLA